MTDQLVVFCACATLEEAQRIAQALVETRSAACVNILPTIQSIYRWQGEIDTAQETLMLIKTTHERFPALRDILQSMHSYNTPEIIAVPIVDALDKYRIWLAEQVAQPNNA